MSIVLTACTAARAAERFDHRGAVGLLVGAGAEVGELVHGGQFDEYSRGIADLGVSVAPTADGNEYKLVLEAAKLGSLQWLVYGGYRGYFGQDRLKTFFDIDAAVDVRPNFTVGPRLALGVQYDFHPLMGLFGGVAARIGIGSPSRFAAGVFAGFQFRSYLLQ
jgi:hypothetical protein